MQSYAAVLYAVSFELFYRPKGERNDKKNLLDPHPDPE